MIPQIPCATIRPFPGAPDGAGSRSASRIHAVPAGALSAAGMRGPWDAMKKAERKKFEQKLLQLRDGLTRNYQETSHDSKSDMDDGTQDYIDFATRSYTKEFLLSLGALERQQLQQVEGALRRVRTEDYGLCVSCGAEISRKRLAAAPWAEFCLKCQEEQERNRSRSGRAFSILGEEGELGGEE